MLNVGKTKSTHFDYVSSLSQNLLPELTQLTFYQDSPPFHSSMNTQQLNQNMAQDGYSINISMIE